MTVMTFDALKMPRGQIIGITMPGFGTTDRTYTNACDLIRSLGVTLKRSRSRKPAFNISATSTMIRPSMT